MTELLSYREQFPILAETNYLISHSLGPMPLEAKARLDEYAHTWSTRGIRAWREGWWETPITIGDKIARLIGAPPGSVVMHQNVTIAAAVVLSCFPFGGERRRIVYGDGEFPSVRYVMQGAGAEVVVVPGQEELLEAIDERTQLVLLSHVLFRTGLIQDVEPVIRRTHEAGAHVLLDAYQSVGAVPLDVGSLRVDFATGGSVKWLCGGPGAGWLYIRPDLAERLEPGFVGWQAHAEPFAFEPEIRHAAGAARFLTGTPNVPALYAASAGYDIVHEVGVDRIRARSLELTDRLIRRLDEAGLELVSPREAERRGGTVVVRVPDPPAVYAEMERRAILADVRPDVGIRLGPHFFTTDDEVDEAAAVITELAAKAVA
ncbi:MAG TPA: aminotransferase class V-fold PLP-dependent enzyme [Gaiellaceae bacterium]|nr:aminotransferase class V-fold PLP-dependent enzyme [Gaiellaceae bacterium]